MKFKLFTLSMVTVLLSSAGFSQSQAKLIVYRPASIYGSLANYKVIVDNKEVATLKTKSMYEMDITPGTHTVSPKQSNRAISINAKPGETYVVEYKTPLHILCAKPKLQVMSIAEAQKDKRFQNVKEDKKMSM